MNECHERARHVLAEHTDELHRVAKALLERETLDAEDIRILLNNGTLPPIRKNSTNNGGGAETPGSTGEPEEAVGRARRSARLALRCTSFKRCE